MKEADLTILVHNCYEINNPIKLRKLIHEHNRYVLKAWLASFINKYCKNNGLNDNNNKREKHTNNKKGNTPKHSKKNYN